MPLDMEKVRELRPQTEFYYFPTTGSTMTEMSRLLGSGAGASTVVVADEQTAGIGRFGRSWISEKDAGIYTSIILRLPLAPAEMPIASLVIGLAVAEAIEKSSHLACDLRWPNDVLIADRKVAGILTQLVDEDIIAGVGINVNNTAFPDDLRTPATSLLLASGGRPQNRERLLAKLLDSLDSFSDLLVSQGSGAILRTFAAASTYVMDRRVIVEESGVRGTTAGLDQQGFLLVRSHDSGVMRRISSGGIRPDPEASV